MLSVRTDFRSKIDLQKKRKKKKNSHQDPTVIFTNPEKEN